MRRKRSSPRRPSAAVNTLTPHTGQRRLLALPGRFKVAICGRRFGKTTAGALAAAEAAEDGGQVLWIDPSDDQCKEVYTEVADYLMQQKGWTATRQSIYHTSGGRIRFASAGKRHTLRGPGLDLVIIDEVADVPEEVWKTIILPMLLERDGKALLMGTPRGRANWLHALFERAACDPKWSRLHLPTSANPRITLKQLNAFKSEMTDIEFRQEFEAEFLDAAESIFPGIEQHLSGAPRHAGAGGRRYTTGIDLGQVAYCACASIDPRTNVLDALTRWNKQPWAVNEARVRNHLKRFPGPAIIDATGVGSKPAEDMMDICRPFIFNEETRTVLLTDLAVAWESEAVKICNDPVLIHELRCMMWTQAGEPPHTYLRATTTTEFCDTVMAFALAWRVRRQMGDGQCKKNEGFAFA